jgi:hypothetical protein
MKTNFSSWSLQSFFHLIKKQICASLQHPKHFSIDPKNYTCTIAIKLMASMKNNYSSKNILGFSPFNKKLYLHGRKFNYGINKEHMVIHEHLKHFSNIITKVGCDSLAWITMGP